MTQPAAAPPALVLISPTQWGAGTGPGDMYKDYKNRHKTRDDNGSLLTSNFPESEGEAATNKAGEKSSVGRGGGCAWGHRDNGAAGMNGVVAWFPGHALSMGWGVSDLRVPGLRWVAAMSGALQGSVRAG